MDVRPMEFSNFFLWGLMIGLVNEEMTEFLFKLIVEELLINKVVSSNPNKTLRFIYVQVDSRR